LLPVRLLLPVGLCIRRILGLLIFVCPPISLSPRYAVGHCGRRAGNHRGSCYSTNESHRFVSSFATSVGL
jgi:hypothetical protein